MNKFKRIASASVTLTCLLAGLLMPTTALGLANPTPDQHWVAVDDDALTDGNVRAVVAASDGSYYVAGDFNNVGRSYGNAVLASASTGLTEDVFPDVDGDVYVTISDGDDGWYIGGVFTRVGTLQREGVAHILPDGTPDEDFAPVIGSWGGGTVVYALAMGEDDDILYVGGDMEGSGSTTFSGVTVTSLVALDAATGAVAGGFAPDLDDDVPTTLARGSVYALAYDEPTDTLYAGGSFDKVGLGTSRNNLVAFDGSTGATTSFDGNANGVVYALAMDPASGDVYAGGDFTTVVVGRNRLALLNSATGVATSFDPDMDDAVYALSINAADPTTLYAGGVFTDVGGIPRNHIAAIDTTSANATGWDPDVDDDVFSMALTSDGSTIYAVGPFTEVNVASGSGVARNGVAAFRITDGDDIAGFSQSMSLDPYFISLNDNDTAVLIGAYNGVGPGPLVQYQADQTAGDDFGGPGIIHILADGTRDPDFLAFAGGPVLALALSPDESTLYVGGDFGALNGNTRYSLGALDTSDGSATDFDPDVNGIVLALDVSSDGNILYAGGDFTAVNQFGISQTRNHLAAFDTGTDVNNATAFDPDVDGTVYALALTADDNTLYAGGDFLFVNGATSRQNLAAFDTGAALVNVTTFDPDVNDSVYALALSGDELVLYAGGAFSTVNGNVGTEFRDYAAAFNTDDAGSVRSWDPVPDDVVRALAVGPDGVVYLGGEFDTVGGDDHEYIAAVDETGDVVDAFDSQLSGVSDQVFALAHGGTNNGLLAGGVFNNSFNDPSGDEVPYVVVVGLAHYQDTATPLPTPTPATPTPTPHHSGGGGGAFLNPEQLAKLLGQPTPTPSAGSPLERYGLHEGDVMGAPSEGDPDVYIVNEWGFKRLFLNPIIFSFYGHLGFAKVHGIVGPGRDAFPTSGLFRNCEANDPKVYAVEVTGEDTGLLHHVNVSGDVAVSQDPDFFHKVFCVNNREFGWYPKSPTPYTSLSQLPVYRRP